MHNLNDITHVTRFTFAPNVPMDEVAGTLELSRLAAVSLLGPERVALEAPYSVDLRRRTVTIATATRPGRTWATVFYGLARREFGGDAVTIARAAVLPTEPRGVRQIAGAA